MCCALGADGKIVELRFAYLDWLVPETEVKVRMGLQHLRLPGILSHWGFGAVFGHDMAGINVSSPVYKSEDLNVDATFFWARPYNDNSQALYNNDETQHLDNLDVFALSVPIRGNRFRVNPWFMYAMIGKYSLTNLTASPEPAQVVPRGGLMLLRRFSEQLCEGPRQALGRWLLGRPVCGILRDRQLQDRHRRRLWLG